MAPNIVTRAGWGARAPRSTPSKTSWSNRLGVAVHHSAGSTTTTPRQIQNGDMDSDGFIDVGYNWLVDQDGTLYEGRSGGWLAIGAHAANQNTGWIGVCWIGHSGNVDPSPAALATIRWVYDEACRLAGRRLDVRGHGQVPGQATECPGSRLRAWIADGLPIEEDEVSYDEVWERDRMEAPDGYDKKKNPTWRASSVLRSAQLYARLAHEQVGQLRGEVAGLTTLVQKLLTAPPVEITPDALAELLDATRTAAREGALQAAERIDVVVRPG